MLKYVFILLLTLLSFGCWSTFTAVLTAGSLQGGPQCPDPPSVAWMVPQVEGQPDQLSGRRMSVQGAYAPKAEIVSPRDERNCWTTAGLPLDTLKEAVSTALAHAGLLQFVDRREGGIYMLQFEVKRQCLKETWHDMRLRSYTATIVVSYSVSVNDGEAQIWNEEITGEHVIEYGPAAAPRNCGSRSDKTTAIEGAVANNLRVLIRELRELLLDKDRSAG